MLRECCNRRNRGFSLVEILLAIAIFLTIASVLYGTLFTGFRMNKRLEEAQTHIQQTRIVIDQFVQDLENVTIFHREYDLIGKQSYLELTLAKDSGVKRIRYRVETNATEEGGCEVLWREEKGVLEEAEKYEGRILAQAMKPGSFELTYAYALENSNGVLKWEQEWREKYLPAGVHVEFQLCPTASNRETEIVQRNIFIPLGDWGKVSYAGQP